MAESHKAKVLGCLGLNTVVAAEHFEVAAVAAAVVVIFAYCSFLAEAMPQAVEEEALETSLHWEHFRCYFEVAVVVVAVGKTCLYSYKFVDDTLNEAASCQHTFSFQSV